MNNLVHPGRNRICSENQQADKSAGDQHRQVAKPDLEIPVFVQENCNQGEEPDNAIKYE